MRRLVSIGLTLLALLARPAAAATWFEASSDHFIIYANSSEKWIRGFATRLEKLDAGIRYIGRLDDPPSERSNRLIVYVVPNTSAVRRIFGKGAANVAGFYMPRAGGSIVYTPQRTDGDPSFQPDLVLFHEYGHHILFRNFASVYPSWYAEGFAEMVSTSTIDPDGKVWIGRPAQHRAYTLATQSTPVASLFTADRRKLGELATHGLYARGWLLTHYLTFEEKRAGQLAKYLTALNAGKSPLDAGTEAFGDLKQLDRDLDAYLHRSRITAFALTPDRLSIGEVSVRAMTAGESAIMPVRIRSDRGVNEAEAAEIVVEARRIAADYPNDPAVQIALAEAEFDAGSDDAADAAADRALAVDPNSIGAMLYKGRVAVRRAKDQSDPAAWRAARSWFVKANRLDGANAEAPLLFYTSFRIAHIPPTANAIQALHGAFGLAPEDDQVRYLAVREMLAAGKLDEARHALAILAYNPHRAPDNWAAKALALIESGKSDQLAAFLDKNSEAAETENGDGDGGGDGPGGLDGRR